MKFLGDMGVSQAAIKWLKGQGFDAIHVRDINMRRSLDGEILSKAKNEGRIVLTCDLDFGTLLAASGECTPSVIIFRLENETPVNVIKRLKRVLYESHDTLIKGSIIVVEEGRHRVRKLPI